MQKTPRQDEPATFAFARRFCHGRVGNARAGTRGRSGNRCDGPRWPPKIYQPIAVGTSIAARLPAQITAGVIDDGESWAQNR
jgi:hypothetical protein